MYQKGTKRKFADAGSEEEEEEEAALGCAGVGVGVGVSVGGLGALTGEDAMSLRMLSSYSLQRQTLLNMSLVKLQLCHMLVEPNLCRSVLIANTVRHIQEEMTYDLTWQVGAAADALSHAHTQAECLATSDLLCRSALTGEEPEQQPATPFNALSYAGCGEDEDGDEEEVVVDEDGDVPLSSVASAGPFLSGRLALGGSLGPCWQGEPIRDPEEMDDDEDEFGKGGGGDTADDEAEDEDAAAYDRTARGADGDRLAKTTEQIFSPLFEANRPTPVPEAALEELFSDVEASYYDLDSMLTGMQGAGGGGGGAGAGGVCSGGGGGSGVVGAGGPKGGSYELLEGLSPTPTPSQTHTHTQTQTQTPLNPATGCRPDLSELDHIMEIIVGS